MKQAHHSDALFQLKSLLPVPNNSGPCMPYRRKQNTEKLWVIRGSGHICYIIFHIAHHLRFIPAFEWWDPQHSGDTNIWSKKRKPKWKQKCQLQAFIAPDLGIWLRSSFQKPTRREWRLHSSMLWKELMQELSEKQPHWEQIHFYGYDVPWKFLNRQFYDGPVLDRRVLDQGMRWTPFPFNN